MRKLLKRFTSGILAAAMVASLVSVVPSVKVEAEETFAAIPGYKWQETSLIQNGDFENETGSDITGWTVDMTVPDGVDAGCIVKEGNTWATNNNSQILNLWNKGTDTIPVVIKQSEQVHLEVGWYYFSFRQEGTSDGKALSGLSVSIGNETVVCEKTTGWDTWKTYESDYFKVDTAGNYDVKIFGDLAASESGNGYWGDFDDIKLYQYLESSTIEDAEITVDKVSNLSSDFMLGTDISAIHSIYASGACCKDYKGNDLTEEEFFKFLAENGVNWVRIRVWNNPYDAEGNGYGGGNNDLEAAIAMGKLATAAGQKVLIDFHYSDFWADPGKQKEPKAWKGESIKEKATSISKFTETSLKALLDAGVDVGMVQIGNETNGALCGVSGTYLQLDDYGNPVKDKDGNDTYVTDWTVNLDILFDAGCDAVHKVADERKKEILAAVHFTNPEKSGRQAGYAAQLAAYDGDGDGKAEGVSYDVFASSYYPFWHGSLENLKSVLDGIATKYKKKVMVAETSYAWTLEDGDGHENTVRVGNNDTDPNLIYPFNVNGQAKWVRDVVNTVNSIGENGIGENGIGVFYWEAAWIPVQKYDADSDNAETVLASNKEKWEAYGSGWASSYSAEYDPSDAGKYYGGSAIDNQAFFDFDGRALDSLRVYEYLKTGSEVDENKITVTKVVPIESSVIYSDSLSSDITSATPETVKVELSDGSTKDIEVKWTASDINAATDLGEYTVNGSVEYNSVTYDATWKLKILPKNELANEGFENGDTSWEIDKNKGAAVTTDDPHSGSKSLHFWNAAETDFTAYQEVELKPGVYTFTGYFQGDSVDVSGSYIFANVDGDEYNEEFGFDGYVNWQNPVIENITVGVATKVQVGLHIYHGAGGWGTCDDFYLYKISDEIDEATAAAAKVKKQINAIGDVTLDKKNAIDEARKDYDALSREAKAKISQSIVGVLTEAEAELALLEAADAVDKLIEAIGEVTLASEEDITTARTAYAELSDEAKAKVTKLDVLTAAEAELDLLKKAAAVEALIDQIDENVTVDSEEAIATARTAYDALSDEAKAKVSAEALTALEKAEATIVESKIDAIGDLSEVTDIADVTDEQKAAVKTARDAYDALTGDAKDKVSSEKKDALEAAEAKLADLQAAADAAEVTKAIEALSDVTLDDKDAVEAARKAYDALSEAAKAKVSKDSVEALKAAEDKIEELEEAEKKAAEEKAAAEKKAAEEKAAAEKKAADDKKAADSVTSVLNALPASDKVNADDETAITAARTAYDALTDDQKKLVNEDTLKKLTDAETALETAKTTPAAKDTPVVSKDTSDKSEYKVTSSDKTNPTVSYTGTTNNKATKVNIPATVTDANGVTYAVTKIADNALKGNKKITSVTVGANITEIGVNAFANCTKLKKITVKSSKITKIGASAFSGDKALTSVDLSKSKVKTIGKSAFANCKKLKAIKINGNKITSIGKGAFKNVKKNAKITIYAKNKSTYNKIVKKIKKSGAKKVKYSYKNKK